MGLLKTLLTGPVTAPAKGFFWVAGKLAERVEAEVFDPKKIQKELEDLQLRYDLGHGAGTRSGAAGGGQGAKADQQDTQGRV